MFREMPRVSPLQLRKQLLVAESELNREQLVEEWQAMSVGIRTLGARAKYVGTLASAAALFVSGVSAFRRSRAASNGAKFSWVETALQGTKVISSIWLAFRSRAADSKNEQKNSHNQT